MSDSVTLPPSPKLVDFIADSVRDSFVLKNRPMTGAVLAEIVRRQFPDWDPTEQFGDHWLAELVRIGESEGKIIRNRAVKHLEVFPPGIVPPVTADGSTQRHYVRPDLWRAFVFVNRPGPSFFDKRNQRVLTSATVDDHSDKNLCQIESIPPTEQQAWMREFVQSNGSLSIGESPIEAENWWIAFPEWLRQVAPELEVHWRRFRTGKVVECIRKWAHQNGVVQDVVLSPVRFQPQKANSIGGGEVTRSALAASADDRAIRDAIISAIGEMPLEDLKNLAIPLRYVLRHFRAL